MRDPKRPDRIIGTFLAGAVGDALGWPNEPAGRNVAARANDWTPDRRFEFHEWTRLAGTRFQPYDEAITAGEYSDDTQLALAVARARLAGPEWQSVLAEVEVPGWLDYERGGGATVKAAARAWQMGRAPWDTTTKTGTKTAKRYFASGANGAAMRIAAHPISHLDVDDFEAVATDVMADALLTHGHPRALLGAIVHSFSIWTALRHPGTFAFGELHHKTVESIRTWATMPAVIETHPGWMDEFVLQHRQDPHRLWETTVREVVDLLEIAGEGIAEGPLNDAGSTLHRLGCQDQSQNGSGTVCAVGALFLATRFAASPATGLMEAAALPHADTDTLASMTGNLLGAICGTGWLGTLAEAVEDSAMIQATATRLTTDRREAPVRGVPTRDSFTLRLAESVEGSSLKGPDGRTVTVATSGHELQAAGRGFTATKFVLHTSDGQTLRTVITKKQTRRGRDTSTIETTPLEVGRSGIRLPITSVIETRAFYETSLGLMPTRTSKSQVNYLETFTFAATGDAIGDSGRGFSIFLEVPDLDPIRRRLANKGVASIDIELGEKGRGVRLIDPDGYNVDVFQSPGPSD